MNDVPTNLSTVYHYVVLLQKDGMFGTLALSRSANGITMLGRSDRNGVSNSIQTDGFWSAKKNFEGSVASSVDVGWRVAWRGFPHGRPTELVTCDHCASIKSSNPNARFCGYCGGEFDGTK